MTRTLGAAVGALLIVFFMAHIATRLATPASAATPSATRPANQR